jgi:hypothetical protein
MPTKTERIETLHNDIRLCAAISNYSSTGKGKKSSKKENPRERFEAKQQTYEIGKGNKKKNRRRRRRRMELQR